ncbi:methyltransf_25 domain-containing protein [Caerostris extrusa]|uniref:Methyltransf_25 domain-containing protein n=1 Tax=Caerostris extrusa TaxID=172846 RepID=A0AAV4XUF6_CAEEX|nr:methyltransf_25 domain-containing protein [Caerostris extrusa]
MGVKGSVLTWKKLFIAKSHSSTDSRKMGTPQASYVSSDSAHFLKVIAEKFQWIDLSDDTVMDVGCGNPKIKFTDLLIERFPNVKQVIAVDKKAGLIEFLKCRIRHSEIHYQFADIEDWSTLKEWEGKISKVVSIHCFHQLKDQKISFQNVFKMLKPGGEVAILFCLQSGYIGWHNDLVNDSKWNKYYNGNSPEIPLTQFSKKEASDYETIEAGKSAILKLALSSFKIPEESKEEFKEDLYKAFMKHNAMFTDKPVPNIFLSHSISTKTRKLKYLL